MLIPLDLPPGLHKNGTEYQSQGRYWDANLWRWFEGTMRPVGGWRKKSNEPVAGAARAIHTWIDNANQTWIAVGTNEGLFVYNRAGTRFDITPAGFSSGPRDATTGGGYGRGKYGRGRYGTPRPDSTNVIPAMVWTLDNWGELLVACDGRKIYEWALDTDEIATPLPNAPDAVAIFCTEQMHIVALGVNGNPRNSAWCDAGDRTAWTPTGTNNAGGKLLQTAGQLTAGKRLRGASILFTGIDAHVMVFGPSDPNVYNVRRLGTSCGAISRQAIAGVDERAFWMGPDRFWMFAGVVEPMPCEVGDYVFANLNRGQASKITAVHNSAFGEVTFFYPSTGAVENDSYVTVNYREWHWTCGKMERLCGVGRSEKLPYPLMVDAAGHLYEHEVGQNRDGQRPYAISGPVEIGAGEFTYSVYGIIPDEANLGDVEVSFTTGDWAMGNDAVEGPYPLTAKTEVRFNARRVSVKYEAKPDRDFRVGRFRFEAKMGGRR